MSARRSGVRLPRAAEIGRCFDVAAAVAGLLLVSPVLCLAALAVKYEDGGPILFRQTRIGRGAKPFQIVKFRTMRGTAGACITAAGDPRITAVGRILRRYKLDELPQLWNVLSGAMSLVGPRPEVPRYVEMRHPCWRRVLCVRPGITDLATLIHRNEEDLLRNARDPEHYYRHTLLPGKLALNISYLRRRTLGSDFLLIVLTVYYSLVPSAWEPAGVLRRFLAAGGDSC